MKIEFTVSAKFEAEITEDIAYDVMTSYNGNFKAWMEDNNSDYICESEFEIDDISYSDSEAQKMIKDIKSYIEKNGDVFLKRKLRTKLFSSRFPEQHIPSEMTKIEVDLELMEKLIPFVGIDYPKYELNYIHIYKDYAEATNTNVLIRHKHKLNFDNDIFFPIWFIEPLKDGAELFVWNETELFLKYKNEWFEGLNNYRKVWIDTKRILSKDDFFDACPFIENRYENNIKIETQNQRVQISTTKAKYYISEDNYKKINSFKWDIIGCFSNKERLPLFLKNEDFEIVVMQEYL